MPGTNSKGRYSVSGQVERRAQNVLKFDQDVFAVKQNPQQNEVLPAYRRDLTADRQAFGGTQNEIDRGEFEGMLNDGTRLKLNRSRMRALEARLGQSL